MTTTIITVLLITRALPGAGHDREVVAYETGVNGGLPAELVPARIMVDGVEQRLVEVVGYYTTAPAA